MNDHLNILSLHRLGDPRLRREAVRELEYMMPAYAPEHNHIVIDTDLPIPNFIKDIEFHAIILGPTFLCNRYIPEKLERVIQQYSFIKESTAFKIAMPQDDYDCSAILDRWMADWEIDLLISVCPNDWSILYPDYSKTGTMQLGYTGYISDRWVADWKSPKNHEQRDIDVSYRAAQLPANFGSIGNLKSAIADRFMHAAAGYDLNLDISTNQEDLIAGEKWHAFLENSKFCLTTSSGGSLLDPEGEYRRAVLEYSLKNPGAAFKEIESACFPGEDKKYVFTAISPRNIEAALACTVQIATPGTYSNLMLADEHFIPLNEDCSNIHDVVKMMSDTDIVRRLQVNCKEALLDRPELYFKNHVQMLISAIEHAVSRNAIRGTEQDRMKKYINRYRFMIESNSDHIWRYIRNKRRTGKLIHKTRRTAASFIKSSFPGSNLQ